MLGMPSAFPFLTVRFYVAGPSDPSQRFPPRGWPHGDRVAERRGSPARAGMAPIGRHTAGPRGIGGREWYGHATMRATSLF